ncbi:element excision factor XisH family protein [Anabaena sp. CCY 9614]|uniref:element excision factor XisH family protein n=1 Tax=Anabaena sp. CCY 9614 TaxID=3103869 RepID=UPI0039C5E045
MVDSQSYFLPLFCTEIIFRTSLLYIAISKVAYNTFFTQDITQLILHKHQLPIIVVDIETEEIMQWIN